jgi:hypothetical protein
MQNKDFVCNEKDLHLDILRQDNLIQLPIPTGTATSKVATTEASKVATT